ncbi:MAG: sensor histidine kinase, partial [Acetatifactor sp.]|nr:sensor histidine kinase [Acetatifactor sp.]
MSFIHDRQARYYCYFLFALIVFIFGAGICLEARQTAAAREMLLTHDNAVAASLLEQGVSREIIATALSNTDTSA